MARFDNLGDWLNWQETLHPDPVDLGLERVGAVARRLDLLSPDATVISVAGTNGKGSSVAMLDAIYRAAGYRTATYTSPHLLVYNERIRLDGIPVDDARLCDAFARIDSARGDISLTYFEFGTLAALEIFRAEKPDVIILEVGMGGRLDAVNIIDADAALVTSIDIDHSEWLGEDRETIAREKGGIFRPGRPAVCADPDPPLSLRQSAHSLGADWQALGEQFHRVAESHSWRWLSDGRTLGDLPLPALSGRHQLDNAAGVICVAEQLQARLPVPQQAYARGLRSVALSGRCQVIPGPVEHVLDVAHNRASAHQLAAWLADRPVPGQTWVVLGMLAGKDAAGFNQELSAGVDHWCLAGLTGERGLTAAQLADVSGLGHRALCFSGIMQALEHTDTHARTGDRVVVTGSFLAVAAALASRV